MCEYPPYPPDNPPQELPWRRHCEVELRGGMKARKVESESMLSSTRALTRTGAHGIWYELCESPHRAVPARERHQATPARTARSRERTPVCWVVVPNTGHWAHLTLGEPLHSSSGHTVIVAGATSDAGVNSIVLYPGHVSLSLPVFSVLPSFQPVSRYMRSYRRLLLNIHDDTDRYITGSSPRPAPGAAFHVPVHG